MALRFPLLTLFDHPKQKQRLAMDGGRCKALGEKDRRAAAAGGYAIYSTAAAVVNEPQRAHRLSAAATLAANRATTTASAQSAQRDFRERSRGCMIGTSWVQVCLGDCVMLKEDDELGSCPTRPSVSKP